MAGSAHLVGSARAVGSAPAAKSACSVGSDRVAGCWSSPAQISRPVATGCPKSPRLIGRAVPILPGWRWTCRNLPTGAGGLSRSSSWVGRTSPISPVVSGNRSRFPHRGWRAGPNFLGGPGEKFRFSLGQSGSVKISSAIPEERSEILHLLVGDASDFPNPVPTPSTPSLPLRHRPCHPDTALHPSLVSATPTSSRHLNSAPPPRPATGCSPDGYPVSTVTETVVFT